MRGDRPGRKSGFDINDSDLFHMDQCRGIVVASAIFGITLYLSDIYIHFLIMGVSKDIEFYRSI